MKVFKKILFDALLFFISLTLACLGGYVIANGVFGIFGAIISNNNELVFRLFYFIPYFIIVSFVMFFVPFKTEYKREKYKAYETAISSLFACGMQMLFAFLINFTVYTSGPALPIGQIIYAGSNINMHLLDSDVPYFIYAICMLIFDIFYTGFAVLGGFYGQKKRKKAREALYNEVSKTKGG